MEKELLSKIYKLRKVKPSDDFVRGAKENILAQEETAEKESVLLSPTFQHGFVMAGAFVFLVFFGYLAFPLTPEYDPHFVSYPQEIVEQRKEREEELDRTENKIAEHEDGERVEVAEREETINQEFATLEEGLREIQRQVFGTKISEETGEERETYSDKEIAEYLIAEMEEDGEEDEMTMSIHTTAPDSDEEDSDKVERARNAMEEEDYGKVFDIYLE